MAIPTLEYIRKHKFFILLSAIVLFGSFAFNALGAMSNDSFLGNFKDSEALVSRQLACKGDAFGDQMLEAKTPASIDLAKCDSSKVVPYSSQFGLQGRVYTLGYRLSARVIGVHAYIALAELATALFSTLAVVLIAVWVRRRYSPVVAWTFVLLVAMSPMVVGFARNLYWALPLLLAPFVYALYLYDRRRPWRLKLLFWVGLWFLLCLRFLCGYEYLTTITIMVMAAVSYHLFLSRPTLKTYARELGLVLGVSVLSFASALGIHIFALQGPAGSTANAINIIKARAIERTANADAYLSYPITGLKTNLPEIYRVLNPYLGLDSRPEQHSRAWAALSALINYTFLPVVNLPATFTQPFSAFAQSLAAFVALLGILYKKRYRLLAGNDEREVKALYVGAAVGLAGFISWLALAPSHSLVHAHINGILLYLPFALFGYIIIGLMIQRLITRLKRLRGNPA